LAPKKKSKNEQLQEKLVYDRESTWLSYKPADMKKVFAFSEKYKDFLSSSKTERLCTANVISALTKSGFKNISSVKKAKPFDKLFKVFKNKTVIAFIVGKNPEDVHIIGSHMDSPRLDLKPLPLYEDADLALLQSHYYGGVKKYHWVNLPLALHGVIFTKKGKKVTLSIGEKDSEPKFLIPDLLPHLGRDQLDRKGSKVVSGEELNIVVGSLPVNDKAIKEQVKFAILKKLHEDYGLIEEDFATAELEFVPASKAVDVGFDRSLIGAYGQDDKVCVYTSLQALLSISNPSKTAVALFVDKEEIGSVGDTGADSFILKTFAEDYVKLLGLKITSNKILELAKAISADVTAGLNPNYKDVQDSQNVSFLGHGVSVEKYGGGGGKYSTNDAHAEYMSFIRLLVDKHKVPWQTGEMGKIDIGGGGTIAMFMSRYGMDTVDVGPCVLGMHSPCELTSKSDVYSAYLFYKAFFEA